ncbi:MAG TPA: aldehyde dehydrogenase family protein, partial [Albitalea sp.]|nr:aldehyde dehydrogenase family protein [Albitalea sp.]
MAPELPFDTRQLFIGGHWRVAASGETVTLENPSDGSVLAQVARGMSADIDAAVAAARRALDDGEWGRMSPTERGRVLSAIGARVLEQVEMLAQLEALDVGKPLKQGRADAIALARYLEFYGGAADKVHGQTLPYQTGYTVLTLREPHGVTGHIVPWNYPMQIVGRSVGAALAMGNACVLKPAEEACLTVLAFARIAHEAGLPPGALNVVTGLGEEAGAALASHPGVAHLSFTGSPVTGALVQAAAAKNATPVTLELGGKSPQIVFADADLDAALPYLVNAGIQNAGQTCSAASRILVERSLHDAVLERMASRYSALRVGPALSDLDVGPVISRRQHSIISRYLAIAADGVNAGLRIVAQGAMSADAPAGGHYVRPTLIAGVPDTHALAQEEIFGPVQVLIAFDGEADALRIANGTPYG